MWKCFTSTWLLKPFNVKRLHTLPDCLKRRHATYGATGMYTSVFTCLRTLRKIYLGGMKNGKSSYFSWCTMAPYNLSQNMRERERERVLYQMLLSRGSQMRGASNGIKYNRHKSKRGSLGKPTKIDLSNERGIYTPTSFIIHYIYIYPSSNLRIQITFNSKYIQGIHLISL